MQPQCHTCVTLERPAGPVFSAIYVTLKGQTGAGNPGDPHDVTNCIHLMSKQLLPPVIVAFSPPIETYKNQQQPAGRLSLDLFVGAFIRGMVQNKDSPLYSGTPQLKSRIHVSGA